MSGWRFCQLRAGANPLAAPYMHVVNTVLRQPTSLLWACCLARQALAGSDEIIAGSGLAGSADSELQMLMPETALFDSDMQAVTSISIRF